MSAINRKDGFYKVKYKGEWVMAKWVTNQDIDSSWSCWWIEGEKPKAWGWDDKDFDSIIESSWSEMTDKNEIDTFGAFLFNREVCRSEVEILFSTHFNKFHSLITTKRNTPFTDEENDFIKWFSNRCKLIFNKNTIHSKLTE